MRGQLSPEKRIEIDERKRACLVALLDESKRLEALSERLGIPTYLAARVADWAVSLGLVERWILNEPGRKAYFSITARGIKVALGEWRVPDGPIRHPRSVARF